MELPIQLQTAIENELTSKSINKLSESALELSKSYRQGIPLDGQKHLRSKEDVSAYAAFRLPATFASVYSAINQARNRYLGWNPKSLLDLGAGPGTAMWAAMDLCPNLEQITLLEQEDEMINLGKRLATYSPKNSMHGANWIKDNITEKWQVLPHDLVIASYVLNELPEGKREAFIKQLWDSTMQTLIIIEPGTPEGFLRIKKAREELMAVGAKTLAPCPHDKKCPISDKDWCHFSERVARSKIHRKVKSGELSYEDEKFSFLCMSRFTAMPISGVVLRHPQIHK
jgi:ribosomal protein RSM22 (predicted rRNA methylase)